MRKVAMNRHPHLRERDASDAFCATASGGLVCGSTSCDDIGFDAADAGAAVLAASSMSASNGCRFAKSGGATFCAGGILCGSASCDEIGLDAADAGAAALAASSMSVTDACRFARSGGAGLVGLQPPNVIKIAKATRRWPIDHLAEEAAAAGLFGSSRN